MIGVSRVLIVTGRESERRRVSGFLRSLGYMPGFALRASTGIAILDLYHPQLVIVAEEALLDETEASLRELCEPQDYGTHFVMVCSGSPNDLIRHEAAEAGALTYGTWLQAMQTILMLFRADPPFFAEIEPPQRSSAGTRFDDPDPEPPPDDDGPDLPPALEQRLPRPVPEPRILREGLLEEPVRQVIRRSRRMKRASGASRAGPAE